VDAEDAPGVAPQDAPATEEDFHPHARGTEILFPYLPPIAPSRQISTTCLDLPFTHFIRRLRRLDEFYER